MKMTVDLERIGDYASNVAKRSIVLAQFTLPYSLAGLGHMARLVQENLKLTVDAIGENDADKAMQVWRSDLMVDDIYTVIFREADHLHDGGPTQHNSLHSPVVYCQEPGANR